MKIEISVQEYFNELKLMEKHYGQEEDLYPWIYMLLQMAECKKKEILKDWYEEVSIRDVDCCKNYYEWQEEGNEDYWKIRWELYKNVGYPDFAIVCNNKVVGCVEVKKLGNNLFNKKLKEEYEYNLETDCEELKYILKEKKVDDFIKNLDPECGGKDAIKGSKTQKTKRGVEYTTIEVESNKAETILKKYAGSVQPSIGVKYYKSPVPIISKEKNQVLGHLVKFGKVIYTNGLEFYLLTMSREKNSQNSKYKINVTELANLTNSYENYKSGKANVSTLLEAAAEWDKLIAGLTKINWYAEPTTLISEDSK